MRIQTLIILTLSCALGGPAFAQDAASAPSPLGHAPKPATTTALPPSAANVGPNDPVLTLSGACKSEANGCVSSISREQFEKLTTAIKPDMTTDQKRNFATQYGKLLVFADQARALGLENDPNFQQILQFARNQILVEVLNKHYSEEYSHPSEQQIQDYYNQNSRKFIDATLQRIIIPSEPAASDVKKPTAEDQKAYVEKLQQQWVGGADPATLQKDAMTRMGLSSSPDVNITNQRPGTLAPDQDSVFDLKPGEISKPFFDAGAAYIYKMVSVKQQPLNDVKAQISKSLHDQAMRERIQQLNESAKPVLNEAYFGPEKAPGLPPGFPAPAQQPASPPAQSGAAPTAQPGAAPTAQSSAPPSTPPQR